MELRDQLQSTLGSAYAFERELAGGAMSRVFVAEEIALRRPVVVKVLPPALSGAISVERFTREIQLAARLQHPHIVPVLTAGVARPADSGGAEILYYTMPMVQGETLRATLARDGRMSVADAVRVTCDVADALNYAHGQGVVHRDIKPENILLSGGHALVVDFGIAKAIDASKSNIDASLTGIGISIGTPAYMSPEQAAGESAIDARSDIYSLAAVLYEMLAGRAPFTGPTAAAVLAKRFTEKPVPLHALGAAIPPAVERAIERGMAIAPDERFSSAADFGAAVHAAVHAAAGGDPLARSLSSGEPAPATQSIAVLPFANMSADTESEYFSDGMTEEIINALAHLPGLRVAARTSVFAFKGKQLDVAELGAKLKVATVLEGSVRLAGRRVRITAQLINVADGFQMWSERFDRELVDVFAIQDEIARAIAAQLRVKLAGPAAQAVVRRGTNNIQAYDLYLKGRSFWARRGKYLRTAVDYFTRAIAADPGFAAPHAWLADCDSVMAMFGDVSSSEASERARAAAYRALALDGQSAESHFAVGSFEALMGWNLDVAERELRRAGEINPSWAMPRAYLALILVSLGRDTAAQDLAQRSLELEPLSPLVNVIAGLSFAAMGLQDECREVAERVVELDDAFPPAHWVLGWSRLLDGRVDDALSSLQRAVTLSGGSPLLSSFHGSALAQAGRREEATRILSELENRGAEPAHRAVVCWQLGDEVQALALYARTVSSRTAYFYPWARAPGMERLARDPRWHAILRGAGLGAVASAHAALS